MSIPSQIFIDTSFFKALLDEHDDFHKEAQDIWEHFLDTDTKFITSNYIIDESLTLIRYKCKLSTALKLRLLLHDFADCIDIARITTQDDAAAWHWFEKEWKKLSFTDCTSFAMMKRLGITHAATFDDHFVKAGFQMLKG